MTQDKNELSPDSEADSLLDTKIELQRAIYEQEHRLIPAVYNFFLMCFSASKDERGYYFPPVIKALFWCLLPSPGTASVGVLAVLTLFVAVHQSSLLQTQNDKIEIQNILAEAERRSTLMFETVAIFEQIEREKDSIKELGTAEKGQSVCSAQKPIGPCWLDQQTVSTATEQRSLFVPSVATVGRLAALTQALRPYRYLQVEGAEQGRCPAETASPALDSSYEALLAETFNQAPGSTRGDVPTDIAKSIVEDIYNDFSIRPTAESLNFIVRFVQRMIGFDEEFAARLNCGPSSPERGQLLVSLHAAGVDISAIENGGGNFTYADIPGANLTGINLKGVRLNNARLPGASFQNARLSSVHLRGADIDGARFSGAVLEAVDFEGARVQIFDRAGDAPIFFLPPKADNVLVSGIRFYEQSPSPNLEARLCSSFKYYPSAFTLPDARNLIAESTRADLNFFDLSDYGMLIETRNAAENIKGQQRAVLMFGIGLPKTMLYQKGDISLTYVPLSGC